MNIFILDHDIEKNVRYYVDRHICKMGMEAGQLLSSVHHFLGGANKSIPYRLTHKNHPCAVWTRASLSNYQYLATLGLEIFKEYTYRYGRIHLRQSSINWLQKNEPDIPDVGLTPFYQAIPEELRNEDVVKAYRTYYNRDKRHLFSWKYRKKPEWIIGDAGESIKD